MLASGHAVSELRNKYGNNVRVVFTSGAGRVASRVSASHSKGWPDARAAVAYRSSLTTAPSASPPSGAVAQMQGWRCARKSYLRRHRPADKR